MGACWSRDGGNDDSRDVWVVPLLAFICYIKIPWRQGRCDRVMHWQEENRSRKRLLFNTSALCLLIVSGRPSQIHTKRPRKKPQPIANWNSDLKVRWRRARFLKRETVRQDPVGTYNCCALVNKSDKQIQDRLSLHPIWFAKRVESLFTFSSFSVFLFTLHFSVKVSINPHLYGASNRSLVRRNWTHFSVSCNISQLIWVI